MPNSFHSRLTQVEDRKSKLDLKQAIFDSLAGVWDKSSSIGEILQFAQTNKVQDETAKFLIKDTQGNNIAVALCSSPVSPELVTRGVERSRQAQKALGVNLCDRVLDSLCEGEFEGLGYAIYPYCQPLSDSRLKWYIQRCFLSPALFNWLHRSTSATVTEVSPTEIEESFVKPLSHLAKLEIMSESFRSSASQALNDLMNQNWSPRYVLMHNDLWKGNILLKNCHQNGVSNKLGRKDFVLTDWSGSMVKGYAIYDLIRAAGSLKLKKEDLRQQIAAHCQILQCDFTYARYYLLAALGYLSLNLEHFPQHLFVGLADSSLRAIEEIQK